MVRKNLTGLSSKREISVLNTPPPAAKKYPLQFKTPNKPNPLGLMTPAQFKTPILMTPSQLKMPNKPTNVASPQPGTNPLLMTPSQVKMPNKPSNVASPQPGTNPLLMTPSQFKMPNKPSDVASPQPDQMIPSQFNTPNNKSKDDTVLLQQGPTPLMTPSQFNTPNNKSKNDTLLPQRTCMVFDGKKIIRTTTCVTPSQLETPGNKSKDADAVLQQQGSTPLVTPSQFKTPNQTRTKFKNDTTPLFGIQDSTTCSTTSDHSYYATPIAEKIKEVASSARLRPGTTNVRRSLNLRSEPVSSVHSLMTDAESREAIEGFICSELEAQLTMLCVDAKGTGDDLVHHAGSLMNMEVTDPRISNLVELGLNEFQKRLPLVFRMMSILTNSPSKSPVPLFMIYAILISRHSQRFNTLQKLLTAACIRHHAGNAVITV